MANRPLPAGRYFGALLLIVAVLYALIFLTGSVRTPQLGLDLRGGTTVTLTAKTPNGKPPAQDDLELARQIIEQRVNGLGVAEAEVVTEGDSTSSSRCPATTATRPGSSAPPPSCGSARWSPARSRPPPRPAAAPAPSAPAREPTGSARPRLRRAPTSLGGAHLRGAATRPPRRRRRPPPPTAPRPPPARPDPNAPPVTQAQAAAQYATLTCDKENVTGEVDRPDDYVATCSRGRHGQVPARARRHRGHRDRRRQRRHPSTTGDWIVILDFNPRARRRGPSYTAANVGKRSPFTLDGRVISAPTINGAINGGRPQITGSFNQTTATELANQLKYGALPLSFTQATAQSISTELGAEQLKAGLIAGAIGIALVFVYALLYYRLLGLVMIASLILSAVVVYACLVLLGRQIGFTLSLAGIAGFIVSIGITADSFVVFFERLKDEIREGRTLRSAVPRAWVRARRTILSADAVSFLAAAILYWLAIGDVKGFAFTLGHVDGARPRRRLPLHPPADGRAVALPLVRQQPVLRARPRRAHPADTATEPGRA